MHFDSREMQRGVRKVFDELVNYPGYQDHELKAFYEFVVENKRQFQWLGVPFRMKLNE